MLVAIGNVFAEQFQPLGAGHHLEVPLEARVRQDKPARDATMRRACLEYGYTMAAVAREAELHYSTVSKVIKGER
jgi:putative transposase